MAPSRTERASTTLMATRSTTTRAISRSVPTLRSIWGSTPNYRNTLVPHHKHWKLLQDGIAAQRGGNGTGDTPSAYGRTGVRLPRSVFSAVANTTRCSRPGQSTVPETASRQRAESRGSITKQDNALGAGQSSRATSTATPGTARARVLRVIDRGTRSDVYNLKVEGSPEYFAGGVLVHNCDALRYLVWDSAYGVSPTISIATIEGRVK